MSDQPGFLEKVFRLAMLNMVHVFEKEFGLNKIDATALANQILDIFKGSFVAVKEAEDE